ncbi:BapA prefix-like domain-containing protein [Acinetobacter gerneri]|uniref:BapA/Bap/LapF family prefix-like domain-containing protein n=1 Tax=Acinetobacter gerneri TaxID=202952 RepID=UPI003AF9CC37
MNNVSIISKASHQIIDSGLKYDFDIQENSVVLVEVSTKQIKKIERIGNDLFIHFNDSDEVLKITNFYNNQENSDNSLS